MVIMSKEGDILRVEVKTGQVEQKETSSNFNKISFPSPSNNQYDVLAIFVGCEDNIIYVPQFEGDDPGHLDRLCYPVKNPLVSIPRNGD
jgi:hypothetical protein